MATKAHSDRQGDEGPPTEGHSDPGPHDPVPPLPADHEPSNQRDAVLGATSGASVFRTPLAASASAPIPRGGRPFATLTIDLDALTANYRALCKMVAGPDGAAGETSARVAGVVKADAYGLGAPAVVETLFAAGCRTFFVAQLEEALALKPLLTELARLDRTAPRQPALYVLNGFLPGEEGPALPHGIRPVLNSPEQLERWAGLGKHLGRRLPAALHLDTGMNRLGFSPLDRQNLLADPRQLSGLDVTLVMSHLACADTPEHPLNETQCARFEDGVAALKTHDAFRATRASLSNSAGVLLGPAFHQDLVRPGIALYGGHPRGAPPLGQGTSPLQNPFQPVAHLQADIIQLQELAPGETVGYGATFEAKRAMRIATLGVGYADGLLRAASNTGTAFVAGHPAPYLGRVSMDLIVIDVTDVPPAALRPGAPVEILGSHTTIDDLASAAGTIGYEILTSLGTRYARRYRSQGRMQTGVSTARE